MRDRMTVVPFSKIMIDKAVILPGENFEEVFIGTLGEAEQLPNTNVVLCEEARKVDMTDYIMTAFLYLELVKLLIERSPAGTSWSYDSTRGYGFWTLGPRRIEHGAS
jgi:hypothetical protein